MDIIELRTIARDYLRNVTASHQNPITLSQTLLSHSGQPVSLASLVESFGISDEKSDRVRLFENIVVLHTFFIRNPDTGSNDAERRDNVRRAGEWVADAILPSETFAERSPYAIEEKLPLSPDTSAKEHAIYSQGLSLLSNLLKSLPIDPVSPSTTTILTSLAAFSDPSDPWTTSSTYEQSTTLISEYLAPDHLPTLLNSLLSTRIKPLFSTTPHPSITPAARKSISPLPQPSSTHSDFEPSTKPWKYASPYIKTVYCFVLQHLSPPTLEANWPLLIPPLLTLLDDSSNTQKTRGCQFLSIFLTQCPSVLLERTGLGSVFEETLMPLLLYLPSLTPVAESITLLNTAYAALIQLAGVRFSGEEGRRKRMRALGSVMRDGVLRGVAIAGEYVTIVEVLVRWIGVLVEECGEEGVKYLKYILPILSTELANPFSTAYPPLLLALLSTLETVILNHWPRVPYCRGEILRGLTICWCRIEEEEVLGKGLRKVQEGVRRAVRILTAVLERDGDVDVRGEYGVLVESEGRLGDLLAL